MPEKIEKKKDKVKVKRAPARPRSKKVTSVRATKEEAIKGRRTKGEVKEEVLLKGQKEERVVYSKANYIRISARKARLVADLVRGKRAINAVSELHFVRKKAALYIRKSIESAIANAENNFEMDKKKLIIKEAYIDEAPTYKRGRAGSRGRSKKILKRNCNIIIGVTEV